MCNLHSSQYRLGGESQYEDEKGLFYFSKTKPPVPSVTLNQKSKIKSIILVNSYRGAAASFHFQNDRQSREQNDPHSKFFQNDKIKRTERERERRA